MQSIQWGVVCDFWVRTTAFSVVCDFNGAKSSVSLEIGYPEPAHHPLHFQASFLGKTRGGVIPSNIMDSIQKVYQLAIENNVDFVELAEYAIKSNIPKDEGISATQEDSTDTSSGGGSEGVEDDV